MKIYKRQTGGVVYNPFMGNTASPQAVTQPTNGKDDSGDEIQKAIIKVLEQNGVPNDVNEFLAQAKRLMSNRDFSLFSNGSDSYYMSDLIRLHSLANQIKWNSESANQAETQVINERAGSDVAINSDGNMYIWDDETKGIKLISPNTYAKNRSQYRPLTNNDLLYLRESMPELAFKNEIFIDLKNVVGINSIVDYMKGIISSFGTDTFKNNQSSYTIKHKGQIEKGFESILDGAAPDGIYKVKSTTETSDQGYNDEKSLLAAAQYLWSTLNPNMKNTLIAHTAAEGLDPNNPLDRYRLLITAIQEHTTHSRSYDIDVDYDSTASKAGSGGASGGSEQMTQLTYLEQVANGRVTADQWVDLRSNTGISNIRFIGNPYQVLDHSEKPVKTESITNMLLDAQIGQIIDQSSISFGNKVLGIHEKSKVLYDSNSPMYRVNLPYDVSYYNSTGKYKPDLDAQAKFEEFVKWVNNNNPSQIMITQKLQELGLNISYDSNRQEWVFNNNKEFIMMTGVTSHRAVDISDKWKGKLSKQEASYLYDYLDENTEFDEGMFGWWGDAASTYKSAIFMPIIDSALATVGTSGEYIPKTYKMDIQNRTRYNNAINNIQTNF